MSLNLYTYCTNNPIVYVDPSGHKPYLHKFDDGKYHFLPDDSWDNTLYATYGFFPFGTDIAYKINALAGDNYYISEQDMFNSIKGNASILSNVVSLSGDFSKLLKLSKGTKNIVKGASTAASKTSDILTLYDIGKEMFTNSAEINQLTYEMYGWNIMSESRDNAIAKYTIYSSFVKKLVNEGAVTYKVTWYGSVTDIKIDWDSVYELKEEFNIDIEEIDKLYE